MRLSKVRAAVERLPTINFNYAIPIEVFEAPVDGLVIYVGQRFDNKSKVDTNLVLRTLQSIASELALTNRGVSASEFIQRAEERSQPWLKKK